MVKVKRKADLQVCGSAELLTCELCVCVCV